VSSARISGREGGRAKLRLSRGFPGCLPYDVTPQQPLPSALDGTNQHRLDAYATLALRVVVALVRGACGKCFSDIAPHSEKLV
jgi:hypothetical protein